MASDTTRHRRLAAIMFADMVGYTAFANRNEAQALRSLKRLKQQIETVAGRYEGRNVKSLGDGFLLEFPSTLAAVQCGLELHHTLRKRSTNDEVDSSIQLRIGIHLGDIEHEAGDVFGNDVNIAQRVQAAAGPGEVWFTEPVFRQVRGHLTERIRLAGSRSLRHLPGHMTLYCIPRPGALRAVAIMMGAIAQQRLLILTGVALFAIGLMAYYLNQSRHLSPMQLAVLPFVTIPDSPENRDLSSGLAQTLCSALTQTASAQRALRVVPFAEVTRSGVNTAREASKLFGATRVLSGTVQRQGTHMRITLNVEDARISRILSSAILDKVMGDDKVKGDVYTLQDELVVRTVSLLGMQVSSMDQTGAAAGRTRNNAAYQSFLEGLGKLARYDKQENVDAAISHFQNALAQDPKYALASASLAEAFWRKYDYTKVASWKDKAIAQAKQAAVLGPELPRVLMVEGIIEAGTGSLEEAEAHLQKVVTLDPANAEVYLELARINEAQGKTGPAETNYRISVDRIPDYWAGYNRLGGFYVRIGRYERAENCFKRALSLTPDSYGVHANLGALYYLMGRYGDAADALRHSIALQPTADAYSNLGIIQFFTGDFADAVKMFAKAAEMDPNNALFQGNLADAYRLAKSETEMTYSAYRKAIELAQGQLAINPKDAATRALLATYHSGLGQTQLALTNIEEACSQAAADVQIAFLSALVHEQAGQRERALAELKRASQAGYSRLEILRHPDLVELRKDPHFLSISNALIEAASATKTN